MLKLFLGGEGNNDLGTRWHQPPGDDPGVLEVLLRRVRPTGWRVDRAQDWKSIRKYKAGAALGRNHHDDARNVIGLVLQAYETACEMLVFVRDDDGEPDRAQAISDALASPAAQNLAAMFRYELTVVGGVARPALEGWILYLRGVAGGEQMSRRQAERALDAAGIELKSTAQYVELARTAALPEHDDTSSLGRWLALAHVQFRRLLDGA
jgi:hypothetical protein